MKVVDMERRKNILKTHLSSLLYLLYLISCFLLSCQQ